MSMSKKDFIAIADAIQKHNRRAEFTPSFDDEQLAALATVLGDINPRFDRWRWLNYIAGTHGPNGGAVKKAVSK